MYSSHRHPPTNDLEHFKNQNKISCWPENVQILPSVGFLLVALSIFINTKEAFFASGLNSSVRTMLVSLIPMKNSDRWVCNLFDTFSTHLWHHYYLVLVKRNQAPPNTEMKGGTKNNRETIWFWKAQWQAVQITNVWCECCGNNPRTISTLTISANSSLMQVVSGWTMPLVSFPPTFIL